VLLPSDTHRKPITSITAVLLPFVTHLLTLPRIWVTEHRKTKKRHNETYAWNYKSIVLKWKLHLIWLQKFCGRNKLSFYSSTLPRLHVGGVELKILLILTLQSFVHRLSVTLKKIFQI
jgi:hypothetical protein